MNFLNGLYAFTLLFIVFTVLFQIFRPTSLWNGAFLLMALALLSICVITIDRLKENQFIILILVGLAMVVFTSMMFFIYIIVGYTTINAIRVLRREKFTLSTSLTLFLAIGNIILIILTIMDDYVGFPWLARYFIYEALVIEGYFLLWYLALQISRQLYRLHRVNKKAKYIIVLGAGLMNGNECTPLLKGRVNKGIERLHKQQKRGIDAKLVMSGGQGSDELIPESHAMRNYAVSIGVDEGDILCEDQSTTTLENMKFSKHLIQGIEPQVIDKEVCFVTSDYHVFRAAHYIRKVGLRSNGEGSKTARYFLPNAVIREYVAILRERPKFHIFIVSLVVLIPLVFEFVFRVFFSQYM